VVHREWLKLGGMSSDFLTSIHLADILVFYARLCTVTMLSNFVKLHDSKLTCVWYIAICMATIASEKLKVLSVSEELEIIKME
jgi:hypothetical protein